MQLYIKESEGDIMIKNFIGKRFEDVIEDYSFRVVDEKSIMIIEGPNKGLVLISEDTMDFDEDCDAEIGKVIIDVRLDEDVTWEEYQRLTPEEYRQTVENAYAEIQLQIFSEVFEEYSKSIWEEEALIWEIHKDDDPNPGKEYRGIPATLWKGDMT